RDWLGGPPRPLSAERRPAALAELARRYLAGHGPASAADLALWAGLPLRDGRADRRGRRRPVRSARPRAGAPQAPAAARSRLRRLPARLGRSRLRRAGGAGRRDPA